MLFRKKGETVWQKANHLDKVTREDMTFTIKEQTDLPALRMIQVEEEKYHPDQSEKSKQIPKTWK